MTNPDMQGPRTPPQRPRADIQSLQQYHTTSAGFKSILELLGNIATGIVLGALLARGFVGWVDWSLSIDRPRVEALACTEASHAKE